MQAGRTLVASRHDEAIERAVKLLERAAETAKVVHSHGRVASPLSG